MSYQPTPTNENSTRNLAKTVSSECLVRIATSQPCIFFFKKAENPQTDSATTETQKPDDESKQWADGVAPGVPTTFIKCTANDSCCDYEDVSILINNFSLPFVEEVCHTMIWLIWRCSVGGEYFTLIQCLFSDRATNSLIPVTPGRRWGTPTGASAVMLPIDFCRLQCASETTVSGLSLLPFHDFHSFPLWRHPLLFPVVWSFGGRGTRFVTCNVKRCQIICWRLLLWASFMICVMFF